MKKRLFIGSVFILIIITSLFLYLKSTLSYHWWVISKWGNYSDAHIYEVSLWGTEALPYVKDGLRSDNEHVQIACAEILSKMSYMKASELNSALIPLLKDIVRNHENSRVRFITVSSLIRVKNEEVKEDLRPLLNDRSDLVKDEVAISLSEYYEKGTIPHLIEILQVGIWLKYQDIDALHDTLTKSDRSLIRCTHDAYIQHVIASYDAFVRSAQESLLKLTGSLWGYNLNKSRQENDESVSQMRQWWGNNKNYLYLSREERHFVVDEEAKSAGVPTDEYRKTHPWPREKKSEGQQKSDAHKKPIDH